jgi:anti-sigma factor RsiW
MTRDILDRAAEAELRAEIAALRRTIDMIASGQVDAVALARAEKRRWAKNNRPPCIFPLH